MFKGSGEATWPTGGGAEGWPGAVQRPMHLGMAGYGCGRCCGRATTDQAGGGIRRSIESARGGLTGYQHGRQRVPAGEAG